VSELAFCKWICPSGTLMAGIPLVIANGQIRGLASWLFGWKLLILIVTAGFSVYIYRPFCRYLCPLGAIYGFFNRISLYRVSVDPDLCDRCEVCTQQCPMSVPVPDDANHPACIRCGECESVCPKLAIHVGFQKKQMKRVPPERRSS
jgi:ferredoxin-type protein NapH